MFHSVLQDVSFLVLAGTYANGAGFLNVPAFFSIVVSLLGIISYFIYLIRERENISGYFLWLKGQAGQLWSKVTNQKPVQGGRQAHPTHSRNRRVGGRSPHGSSESEQSEDGSQVREKRMGIYTQHLYFFLSSTPLMSAIHSSLVSATHSPCVCHPSFLVSATPPPSCLPPLLPRVWHPLPSCLPPLLLTGHCSE